jgi:glutamate-5-semialdehyde dehydrogenase
MSLTDSSPFEVAKAASKAARELATLSAAARNEALTAIYDGLKTRRNSILEANAKDVAAATIAVEKGELSQSILKRLDLNRPGKYDDMLQGILDVRELPDPGMTGH